MKRIALVVGQEGYASTLKMGGVEQRFIYRAVIGLNYQSQLAIEDSLQRCPQQVE